MTEEKKKPGEMVTLDEFENTVRRWCAGGASLTFGVDSTDGILFGMRTDDGIEVIQAESLVHIFEAVSEAMLRAAAVHILPGTDGGMLQ